MKRLLRSSLLAVIALVLLISPVLAQSYYALLQIQETGGTAYPQLALIHDVNNEYLADNGYMEADALDTRVITGASVELPHMVVEDKLLFVSNIGASSTTNLRYTFGNTDLASLAIIEGNDGFSTVDDHASLELADDFTIELEGYIDTSSGSDKNLVYKEESFTTYISGATDVTSAIMVGGDFPTVAATNGGSDNVDQVNHTVDLPAGIVSGNLLLAFFTSDGNVTIAFPNEGTDWIQLYETIGGGAVAHGAWYRIADGTEGANITVVTSGAQRTSHTTYRITGYSTLAPVPAVAGVASTGNSANPNPPNLAPSWEAANTLWFAATGFNNADATPAVTAYPAIYTDGRDDGEHNANAASTGTARRELNAAAENPGTFTIEDGDDWVANTVAIAPADVSVTATGVASGEHTVKTLEAPALYFDGTAGDLADASNHASLNPATNQVSLEAWINSPALDTGGFISKWDGAAEQYQLEVSGGGNFTFHLRHTGGGGTTTLATVTAPIAINTWYHVVVVSDNVDMTIYVDGAFVIDQPYANGIDVTASTLWVGTNPANRLEINVNEMRIYTRALSATEVTEHYNGIYTDETDLAAHWKMDENAGDALADSSLNANTLTKTATVGWVQGPLKLYVDDILEDVDDGASVLDNDNDWIINQNNVTPYLNYYSHTTAVGGSSEKILYEPDSIIVNTGEAGTADAGAATTLDDAILTQANDYWNGARLIIVTTTDTFAPQGETSVVTDFDAAADRLTFDTLTAVIDAGDTYTIDFGTLPNENNPGTYDGRITWGVNPADTTITLGSLTSYSQPAPSGYTSEPGQDVVGETGQPDWTGTTGTLEANPFYPLIKAASDNTGFSVQQVWLFVAFFAVIASMLAIFWRVPHQIITVIVGAGVTGLFVAMGIFPFWVIFIFVLAGIAVIQWERVPNV